jgi:hemoglobin
MTYGDDSQVDRHRVDAFASEDELTIQEFLQAAPTAPARPKQPRRSESSLY